MFIYSSVNFDLLQKDRLNFLQITLFSCLILDLLQMSQRGVWQLQKLTVSYCNWGGSSRGIRYDVHISHFPLKYLYLHYSFHQVFDINLCNV